MPRKCCADVCKTNYLSQGTNKRNNGTKINEVEGVKVCVFGFGPKDSDKRIAWINALAKCH